MKRSVFIKLISLILVMIMATACIVSCGDNGTADESSGTDTTEESTANNESSETKSDSSETTDSESTEDTDADNPENAEILPILKNSQTSYTILTPDSTYPEIATATNELKCLFSTFAGETINVKTVSEFKFLYGEALSSPKIIIGSIADDPYSVELRYALPQNEFAIEFKNNTLYITGKSNSDTMRAWNYFKLTYLYEGMTDLAFEDGFYYESTSDEVSDVTINGVNISNYKIVHCGSFYSEKYAQLIRSAIYRKTGITLSLTTDSSSETEYEILVGKTNREESAAVRAEYDRPNLYYDIKVVGNKLVIMGEGYKTLEHVTAELEKYLGVITKPTNIMGEIVSKDVKAFVDTTPMLDRAEGTDLRVFHYNMAAPLLWNEYAIFKNDTERGEAIADMVLAYYPDIITTDEIYNSKQTQHHINLYRAVMGELGEYYNVVDPSPYDDGKPFEESVGNFNYGINENIIYKKSLNLTLLGSGWRYGSTKVNGSDALYLGFHSAAFEMTNGTKFIVSAGHYGESGSTNIWAVEHHQNIAALREKLGLDENVPTIITGDMFTTKGRAGYNYHVNQGFFDSQQNTLAKWNLTARGDVIQTHGTFHTVGVRHTSRAAEDFVWYNSAFESLQFKVIASELSDRTSDHYPVLSDLKLK